MLNLKSWYNEHKNDLIIIGFFSTTFFVSLFVTVAIFVMMFVSGDFWSILYTPIFWMCEIVAWAMISAIGLKEMGVID